MKIILIKAFLKENVGILLIFTFALILRLLYISHGFPYIINMDEPTIIRSAQGLFYDMEIERFDWPHLNFYLNHFNFIFFLKLKALFEAIGLKTWIKTINPSFYDEYFSFYYYSRIYTAVLGSLTVIPIYLVTKNIFSKKAGLISAFIFTVIPYHVYLSHYSSQDVVLLFFISYAVYFAYKTAVSPKLINIVFFSVFLGLSAGVKYNAVLFGLLLPVFQIYEMKRTENQKLTGVLLKIIPGYLMIFIISLSVFVLTTNNIIRNWDIFWSYDYGRGFLWQLTINSNPVESGEYLPNLMVLLGTVIEGITIPAFVFLIISPFFWIKNFNKKSKYVLTFYITSLIMLLLMSKYERAGARYLMPVYGLFAVILGATAEKFKNGLLVIILGFITIPMIITCIIYLNKFSNGQSILAAYNKYPRENMLLLGEKVQEFKNINSLKTKSYKEGKDYLNGEIILSSKELNNASFKLLEIIDNIDYMGPVIYMYEQTKPTD